MAMPRLALVRGTLRARACGSRRTKHETSTPPDASPLAPPSDDPDARRRELLVVLALCRARAAGARERVLMDGGLTLLRDE